MVRYVNFWKIALAGVGVVIAVGFGIGSIDTMPPYAVVFLYDANKTYIALPCLEEWRSRQTQTVDVIRRSTAGEAWKLGYKIDEKCRSAGGYSADGRSVAGLILEKLGLLSPLTHWWDLPYRTENGIVYRGK